MHAWLGNQLFHAIFNCHIITTQKHTLTVKYECLSVCTCHMQVKIWFQNHRYKTKKAATGGTESCVGSKSSSSSSSSSLTSARPRFVAVSVLVHDGHPCTSQSQPASHSHLSSDVILTSRCPSTNHLAATTNGSCLSVKEYHQRVMY